MVERLNGIGGWWWRVDRYELCDRFIRPVPGAALERYNLWENSHQSTVEMRTHCERRYQPLLELVDRVDREDLLNPTAEFRESMLQFCCRFGLLGILLQRAQSVTLAPRWEMFGGFEPDYTKQGFLVPSQITYERTGLGWQGSKSQDRRAHV